MESVQSMIRTLGMPLDVVCVEKWDPEGDCGGDKNEEKEEEPGIERT